MRFNARHCLNGLILLAWVLCLLATLLIATHATAQNVPRKAAGWKRDVIANSRLVWGLDAPVASFAAQIEQESGWNPVAKSGVGAVGLAQFMPSTAAWISGAYPALSANEPQNPAWAIRALVTYDKWLWDRLTGVNDCEHMAKSLAAYNGGLGNVFKEEVATTKANEDQEVWFKGVERYCLRQQWACIENRNYPRRILTILEPRYAKAGWGAGVCAKE